MLHDRAKAVLGAPATGAAEGGEQEDDGQGIGAHAGVIGRSGVRVAWAA